MSTDIINMLPIVFVIKFIANIGISWRGPVRNMVIQCRITAYWADDTNSTPLEVLTQ